MVKKPVRDGPVEPLEPRRLGLGPLFYRARDAVVVGDAGTGRVVLWNDAAAKLFGYTREEALGLRLEELVPPELKARHRDGLAAYGKTGHGALVDSGQVVELPAVTKSGAVIDVELTLTPLDSDRLAGRFVMAIIRDATERKRADAALREALRRETEAGERLRALDEMKNTFVAMVAHDLRSPMTSVAGFLYLLRDRWKTLSDEQRTDFVDAALRGTEAVTRLVDDVLQVAALESGEIPYELQSLDVRTVVERTLAELRAAHADVRFVARYDGDVPAVKADPERCWQVLTNLLANAVTFTPVGGEIQVSTRRTGGFVEISVADHGPGIAAGDLPKLFARFARINAERAVRPARRTGLGLFICRTMIEAMGGRIWARSELDHGSTFTFTLPVA